MTSFGRPLRYSANSVGARMNSSETVVLTGDSSKDFASRTT